MNARFVAFNQYIKEEQSPMKPQLILAVQAKGLLQGMTLTSGVTPMPTAKIITTLNGAGLMLGVRDSLEKDHQYLQIIPYVVLKSGDKYLRYTRTPAGGESELHGKMSIGVGGHIDGADVKWKHDSTVALMQTLFDATWREVTEEVGDIELVDSRYVGLLVDFTDDVGMVHLGVLEVWELHPNSIPEAKEDALTSVELVTLEQLQADKNRMEKWSQHVVDYLTTSSL